MTESLEVLAARSQKGDRDAYERLLRNCIKVLERFFQCQYGGNTDRDDLVQDTICAVHLGLHSYNKVYPFLPWLLSIARRKAIDAHRGRKVIDKLHRSASAIDHKPTEPHNRVDARLDLQGMKAILESQDGILVGRVYAGDQTARDIAAEDGISVGAAKVRIHRALHSLRKFISARGGGHIGS